MKTFLLLFCVTFLLNCCSAEEKQDASPLVEIPLGKIEGFVKESRNGRPIFSFQGIPYARPPVGKHRFQEPLPVKPWRGILQAKTIYKCMQYYHYTRPGDDFVIGDEDCLYVNVYTPNLNPKANLDVIVYIHGGAFMFNWGAIQGPEYLLDKDVVVVNFNYRLGPLGFLSTESELVPGNNGIKDQIQALEWVRDYVKYFGGNPNSVTITGMSAGGASVHMHYLNPFSKGLFHRGISQSGTALAPWVLMEKPLEKTKKVAALVGCNAEDMKQSIECLKKRPARQIVNTVKEFQPWLYNPFSPFGVVVDTWASQPLLPDHPYRLLQTGKFNDVPWIASFVNAEGLYPAADFYKDEHLEHIDNEWNFLMPFILDYNYTVDPSLRDDVSQKIREFYLADKRVSKEVFMDFVRIISDRMFVVDIKKAASLQAAASESDVYSYFFTYRGLHSCADERMGGRIDFGASHADDTSYVFKTAMDTTAINADSAVVDLMVKMFTSFAKGNLQEFHEWPALSKNAGDPYTYLRIDSASSVGVEKENRAEFEDFWASLPIKENEKLFSFEKDEL